MRNRFITFAASVAALISVCTEMSAQKGSLSTDLLGYLDFVTLNAEASYPMARKWTLTAAVKYNPFTFNLGEGREQARNRQQTYAAGVRFWPWHVYSGWWMSGKVQYQEFNTGGIFSDTTREGDRMGAAIAAGYSVMLGKHLNLEFGAGLWSGVEAFTTYSCPECGLTQSGGQKIFFLPADVTVALSYIF